MAEWLKAHAWKACKLERVSRVRIPVSPPYTLLSCGFYCHSLTRSMGQLGRVTGQNGTMPVVTVFPAQSMTGREIRATCLGKVRDRPIGITGTLVWVTWRMRPELIVAHFRRAVVRSHFATGVVMGIRATVNSSRHDQCVEKLDAPVKPV
jgi:hypothetical protein